MNTLDMIMSWYEMQCNGDWEHSFGVKIDTLDNPGWTVQIDLNETNLSDSEFEEIDIQRSDTDWVYCVVADNQFKGAGGLKNLEELLTVFLSWAEKT